MSIDYGSDIYEEPIVSTTFLPEDAQEKSLRPHTLKEALGMRQRSLWRMLLIALGTATVCVAFLGWLAVLDVDHLEILPLNGTLVVGCLILGAAMGFTGYTPGSMLAQLGGGKPLAGLCAVAGGVAGAVCYGWIASPVEAINGWFPEITGTLSRTTLTSPFLLSGGFLLHGTVGVILLAVGLCVGGERPGQAESPQAATRMEAPPVRSAETAAEAPPSPEDASAETVVASGCRAMHSFAPFYFLLASLPGWAGAVRGPGRSLPPMVVLLISLCLFRVVWIQFVLPFFAGIEGVFVLYPVSWALGAVLMALYAWKGSWMTYEHS